jgi:hypothetical protein
MHRVFNLVHFCFKSNHGGSSNETIKLFISKGTLPALLIAQIGEAWLSICDELA